MILRCFLTTDRCLDCQVCLFVFSKNNCEQLVSNGCVDLIDKHKILNTNQCGFRTGHSTYMALVEFVDKLCNAAINWYILRVVKSF